MQWPWRLLIGRQPCDKTSCVNNNSSNIITTQIVYRECVCIKWVGLENCTRLLLLDK